MRLKNLIDGLTVENIRGDQNTEISHVHYDSRNVAPGDLFVAMKGFSKNGHDYIQDAVLKGVGAIVSELSPEALLHGLTLKESLIPTLIQVSNSRRALSKLAVNFYQKPFRHLNLIGITGTNGKTTTSYLLESILLAAGRKPGVIGTVNRRVLEKTLKSSVTTPESLDLMHILRWMADQRATDVVMEVSSHALEQGRVQDCPFQTALFTNMSRDHLDYHRTMEDYFNSKSLLFKKMENRVPENPFKAVINGDDAWGRKLMALTDAEVVTYGLDQSCHITATDIRVSRKGLRALLKCHGREMAIRSSLIGTFDIYNIMAAAGAAVSMGLDLETVSTGIKTMKGVPGRMEMVENPRSLAIVVDYAHTPDALFKVLGAARKLTTGKILTVFGCGGDRDTGKRPEMGRVAGLYSDKVFITSDNPRSEDPLLIVKQIEKGILSTGMNDYVILPLREEAIAQAVQSAQKEDLVLIAGKGHEDYQIIGNQRRFFDDRIVAAKAAAMN